MKHLEDNLQIACVQWFSYEHQALAPLLVHIPNGGKRNLREAHRFKLMGVRAGAPDLALFVPRHPWHALFVELKTSTGRQSDSQKRYQQLLTDNGYRYEVVRSFEDFMALINDYLL